MSKFKDWLVSTDTPRWLIAAGFLASALVSLGASKFIEDQKRADDNRVQQIRSLQDSMVQFQVFASTITSEMFDNKTVSPEAKNNLIKNLNEQWAKTRILEELIYKEDSSQLESYRSALTYLIDSTRRIDRLTEMSEFWTAASRLLVARNDLNKRLKIYI